MKFNTLVACLCVAVFSLSLYPTDADARGGRGFSSRSFSRPKVSTVKRVKAPVAKKQSEQTKPVVTNTTVVEKKVVAPVYNRDDNDSSALSSFLGGMAGSAIGSAAGVLITDAITSEEEPKE